MRNICRLAAASYAEKEVRACSLTRWQAEGEPRGHVTVINIDRYGNKDLQQYADAIIRLRAEHLYSRKDFTAIHFNFTSGNKASVTSWLSGPTYCEGKPGYMGEAG